MSFPSFVLGNSISKLSSILCSRDKKKATKLTKGAVTQRNFSTNLQCNAKDDETLQVAGEMSDEATLFATGKATHSWFRFLSCFSMFSANLDKLRTGYHVSIQN